MASIHQPCVEVQIFSVLLFINQLTFNKMKKVIIVLALGLLLTSCSSGWSRQKRYVSNKPKLETNC